MGIQEYIKKLERLTPKRIEIETLKIIKRNEEIALDLNTESQLFERGIGADGKKLTPSYTPFTKQIKKAKGQPTNRVTLRDEGDFHDSFFVKTNSFPVVFEAQDWKEQKLVEKYGIEIFGLTNKNRKEISLNYIKPELVTFLKANL